MAGSFEANPPFSEELMEAMVNHFEVQCILSLYITIFGALTTTVYSINLLSICKDS